MRVFLIILMGRNIINCCPVKRSPVNGLKHQTQAPNASTNGGDASRVGKRLSYLVGVKNYFIKKVSANLTYK